MEASGPLQGITAGFSPARDFLAVAYADGRLKTFDTGEDPTQAVFLVQGS